MKMFVLLAIVMLAALLMSVLTKKRNAKGKATGVLTAKRPLTEREQAMYFRLASALPEHVVLAQVAFSALLDTNDRPTRATFDRKVADFVVCTRAFEVTAVIELDDASHRGKEQRDASRDEMITKAGYKVVRFRNIPDADELRKSLQA